MLLVTAALMLAAAMALSGVAQAKPIGGKADAQCAKLAIKTLGSGFNPSNYTFIGGSERGATFDVLQATDGPDVFCGFGGDDVIRRLDAGDIFLGGAGWEVVGQNYGTFDGGDGSDSVRLNEAGGILISVEEGGE